MSSLNAIKGVSFKGAGPRNMHVKCLPISTGGDMLMCSIRNSVIKTATCHISLFFFKQKSTLASLTFYKICWTNFGWQFPLVYLVPSTLQPWDPVCLKQPEPRLHHFRIISSAQLLLSMYYRSCLLLDGCSTQLACGNLLLVNTQQLSKGFWWFHFCFEVTQTTGK